MARFHDDGDMLKCSFCGKSQRQVEKLIAGPGVYICNECIDLCNEIIEEERAEKADQRASLPCGPNDMDDMNHTLGTPATADPAPASFVFALGQVEWRTPSPDVEREIARSVGRADTAGLTNHQALRAALSERSNRYLVREMCWLLSIRSLPTYILRPRDPADFELLLDAVRADPGPLDLDVVIGVRGPLAPPELCNGLELPTVVFDQLFGADRESLIREVPRPESIPESRDAQFRATAGELFDFVFQPDNVGATDEERALNFLLVRSADIYGKTAEMQIRDFALTGVKARCSRLTRARKLVDVLLSYTNRNTDVVELYRATVDVTGKYPNLHTRLSPYYDRPGL